jgi:hypothetical protein
MVLDTGVGTSTVTGVGRHTRRRVLGSAAAMALSAPTVAGCGLLDDEPDPGREPDALQPVLDEALALAARYDRTAAAQANLSGRLTPLAADHRAHATELARLIGVTAPSADPSASAPMAAESLADLRKAEQNAMRTATAAAKVAPADRAALVGSIAACRAAHAEALK